MAIFSTILSGNDSAEIEVECHMTNGLPALHIIGSASRSVMEAKERLRSAFRSAQLTLPPKRITINLAPADMSKNGTVFDLAMAVSVMEAQGLITLGVSGAVFYGELGLKGDIKPVRGIIGLVLGARQRGFKTFYIPLGNMRQALMIPNINIIPLQHLREAYLELSGHSLATRHNTTKNNLEILPSRGDAIDFKDITGQQSAKRALAIAAVGHHNLLLSGAPGIGKTMLAKALPAILPPLSSDEILQVSHLHSLTSLRFESLITARPFRSPHHSASVGALLGTGSQPRPGEISLAHQGVLFLDELPEFKPETREALRQPLEDRQITISRSHHSTTFPADFILVATANLCPCGNRGSDKKCQCSTYILQRYQQRISGPLWDRIDLHVRVDSIRHNQLLGHSSDQPSSLVAEQVGRAIQMQRDRKQLTKNALLSNQDVRKYAKLSPRDRAFLDKSASQLQLSARGFIRVLKVARSIADLENCSIISQDHLVEALQYRNRQI